MSQVSKRQIDPNIKAHAIESLTFLIKNLNSIPDTDKFLASILSDTERLMIAKRIAAAFLLRHNIQSKEIQDILKLTQSTVFRLKLWVETHQEGFDIIFDKLEKQRRTQAARTFLYQILDYAIRAGSGSIPNPFKKSFR